MASLLFPRVLLMNDEMSSTQDTARYLVERDGVDAVGVVIGTANQTAGRGRQGHIWHAPPGANLSNTFIGAPVPLADLWQTAFVAGLAAADAISSLNLSGKVRLRFPNDVLVDGKKVCGILVETATGPGAADGTAFPLIGIGINVLGTVDSLPADVAVCATTLQSLTDRELSIGIVGTAPCDALTARWNEWRGRGGLARIITAWKQYQDTNIRRAFIVNGESVSCRVIDITTTGNALLELPDGSRTEVPVPHIILD